MWLVRGQVIFEALLCIACSATLLLLAPQLAEGAPHAAAGCGADADCAGAGACVRGRCVAPRAGDPRSAATPAPRTKVVLHPAGPPEQQRGDVFVEGADGRATQLTRDGMATQPKLADDGRTVGFVALEWTTYHDETMLAFMKVVLLRDGKRLRAISPEKAATVDWQFHDGAKQIAVASAGMHGMTFFQLFDVANGRLVASSTSANDERPSWAEGLRGR